MNVKNLIKKSLNIRSGSTIQNKCAINHIFLKMIQLSCLGVIIYIVRLFSIQVYINTSIIRTTSIASSRSRFKFFI